MREKLIQDNNIKGIVVLLLQVYIPTMLALGLVGVANLTTGIKISVFTRDPIQVLDGPIYTGVLSNVGILLWAATAAITLFCGDFLRRNRPYAGWSPFLLSAGGLTTLLLLDDLFLFHEVLFPEYLNIHERALPVTYGLLMVLFLVYFRNTIWRTNALILILALGFFGLSIGIDIVDIPFRGIHLFEDGSKLLGIVSWGTYFISTCRQIIRPDQASSTA